MKRKRQGVLLIVLAVLLIAVLTGCGEKEQAPEKEQVLVLDQYDVVLGGDEYTYSNGDTLSLNESGQIATAENTYNKMTYTYDKSGALVKTVEESTNPVEDKVYTNTIERTYADGLPVHETHVYENDWDYDCDVTVEHVTDADGKVTEETRTCVYTDKTEQTTTTNVKKSVYHYNADGQIESLDFYQDGKEDHTAVFTYDKAGNLIGCSCVSAEDGAEYIYVELTYKEVDADTVTPAEIDSFTKISNFEHMLNFML